MAAGHQAAHEAFQTIRQELNLLRGEIEEVTHQFGETEKFNARLVREEDRPKLEILSYLAKDFVGVVHTAQKQAMKSAETQKQPSL